MTQFIKLLACVRLNQNSLRPTNEAAAIAMHVNFNFLQQCDIHYNINYENVQDSLNTKTMLHDF